MSRKKIKTFNFGKKALRTVDIDGEIWFVLKDLCGHLGIRATNAARFLDVDEYQISSNLKVHFLNVNRGMLMVNECGLYRTIFLSKKPQAKAFTKWVTGTLLPYIRKLHNCELVLEQSDKYAEVLDSSNILIKKIETIPKPWKSKDNYMGNDENNPLTMLRESGINFGNSGYKAEWLKGYVYFISTDVDTKIGRTKDPKTRIRSIMSLANKASAKITLIKVDDICLSESWFHVYFDCKRQVGEWFSIESDEILRAIKEHSITVGHKELCFDEEYFLASPFDFVADKETSLEIF